jgi:hypothetical protein
LLADVREAHGVDDLVARQRHVDGYELVLIAPSFCFTSTTFSTIVASRGCRA